MKSITKIYVLILFTFIFVFSLSSNLFADELIPLVVGEKMRYDISVQIDGPVTVRGHVGHVEVTVKELVELNGREVYHCVAEARSLEWVRMIYELHDIYHVWFDAKTFTPYKVVMDVYEGGWTNYITMDFHISNGYGIYNDKRNKNRHYKIPRGHSFDVLTLLYFIRQYKNKEGSLKLNWLETFRVRPVSVHFEKGERYESEVLEPGKKIRILKALEDNISINTSPIKLSLSLAIDHDYVPVYASIPAFKIYGHTIVVQGKLTDYYRPGTERYGKVRDPEKPEGVLSKFGNLIDTFQDILLHRHH